MIGVKTYNIFIVGVVIFDIGEKPADIAVDLAQTRMELCLVDLEIGQTDARRRLLPGKEPLAERQARLDRGRKAKAHRIPRMHVGEVEEREEIGLSECLDMADHAVGADQRGELPRCGDEPVIAAHDAVVYAVRGGHGRRRIVAEVLHALRERQDLGRELMACLRIEELRVMGVPSRLDRGQRRVRVLRCGEMLVEDRAARKEACDARHPCGKMLAYDIPWERIHEDVQHEFFPRGTVPEEDGRSNGERRAVLAGQRRRLREAQMAVRPLAEVGELVIMGRRLCDQLLQGRHAADREDRRASLGHGNLDRAADRARLLQVKGEIAADVVLKPVLRPRVRNHIAAVREKAPIGIGGDPETLAARGNRDRQIFADKDVGAQCECMVLDYGTLLCERRVEAAVHRAREPRKHRVIQLCWPGGQGRLGEAMRIGLEYRSLRCIPQLPVCSGKNAPCRRALGTLLMCAHPADCGALRIPLRKQIARGKDVCVYGVRRLLAIGGKLRQEIIVVCAAFRTLEEIVKERTGALVIAPEYGEIVLHRGSFPCARAHHAPVDFASSEPSAQSAAPNQFGRAARISGQNSPLFAVPLTKSRARG